MQKQHANILILGGGIGGYETYRSLAKQLKRYNLNHKITLLDQNNYFTFTPMLHEAATGGVEPSHCAIPLRSLIQAPHQFIRAKINTLNPTTQEVNTSVGIITYDYVVVALGSAVNYFNTPGAAQFSYNVRTLPAAMRLQEKIIDLLENGPKTLNFTVVGGSYTGVEMIGQLSHFATSDIKKLYPEKKITLAVIQATDTLLPILPPKTRRYVQNYLEKKNVSVILNRRATSVTNNSVVLDTGESVPSDLIIWAAGFANTRACYLSENFCEKRSHSCYKPTTPSTI